METESRTDARYSGKAITVAVVAAAGLYALTTRVMGALQPYHQDEYKWALAVNPAYDMANIIPHPFLGPFLYGVFGTLFGYGELRLLPISLSLIFMILLYRSVAESFSRREALAALLAYVVSTYALLGSVQVDIDGMLLPFITLATFVGYYAWLDARERKAKALALAGIVIGCLIGFSLKLSFVLAPIALMTHFVLCHGHVIRTKFGRKAVIGSWIALLLAVGITLLFWKDIAFLRYVSNFISFSGRDYAQVSFQTIKAVIYLGPLCVFGMLLGLRYIRRLSLWYIFIALNLLFYMAVFDFTHRTFDRYLLFLVLPAIVCTGVALAARLSAIRDRKRFVLLLGGFTLGLASVTCSLFSQSHRVLPLIPKSAFIDAFLSGSWNFLIPMTGGSGPLGFYVPVDALALLWGIAFVGVFAMLAHARLAALGLALFMSASLVHAGFVTHEYLTGHYYGSASKVLSGLVEKLPDDGQKIITYNDIGAFELYQKDRYGGRFYPHTEFVQENLKRLAQHEGLFLIIALPELGPGSPYTSFFAGCWVLAEAKDGLISGVLLDCKHRGP